MVSGAASAIIREHVLARVRKAAGYENDLISTDWSYGDLMSELHLIERRLIVDEPALFAVQQADKAATPRPSSDQL